MRALEVYQGELLPGFYDEWVAPERERLQAICEHKLNLLLDRLVAAQTWPEAQTWAERWIALGQAPEPAYRALMLAHSAAGDRAGMAAAYQRCVEALERGELAVEPSAATLAFYEQLSHSEPAAAGRAPLEVKPPALHNLPRHLTTFIGRERELAEVKRLLTSTPARLLTLTGTGGCGKTRLFLAGRTSRVSRLCAGRVADRTRAGVRSTLAPAGSHRQPRWACAKNRAAPSGPPSSIICRAAKLCSSSTIANT